MQTTRRQAPRPPSFQGTTRLKFTAEEARAIEDAEHQFGYRRQHIPDIPANQDQDLLSDIRTYFAAAVLIGFAILVVSGVVAIFMLVRSLTHVADTKTPPHQPPAVSEGRTSNTRPRATIARARYSAVGDFSSTHNPNSNWSYGFTESADDRFIPYRAPDSSLNPVRTVLIWSQPTGPTPYLGKHLLDDVLVLQPGANGEYSVLRWTAPETRFYRIAGRFRKTGTGSAHVRIRYAGYYTLLDSTKNNAPFDQTMLLTPGTAIDFAAGPVGNSHRADKGIQLLVEITPTGDPKKAQEIARWLSDQEGSRRQ